MDSHQHSFLFSSNSDSSLSSSDSKKSGFRSGSVTPTENVGIEMCSTPVTAKDSTLKVVDKIKFLEEEEEEEGEERVADESTDSKDSRKNTWRLSLFKKRRK